MPWMNDEEWRTKPAGLRQLQRGQTVGVRASETYRPSSAARATVKEKWNLTELTTENDAMNSSLIARPRRSRSFLKFRLTCGVLSIKTPESPCNASTTSYEFAK